MHEESHINRRKSKKIYIGSVAVGGDAPVSVQSMTNTETCDTEATINQINAITNAGADLVRVSVPTLEAADAFKEIRSKVRVPLIADIHFNHKIALKVMQGGVDCLRINPGNIGSEERVKTVVKMAADEGIPIRVGVNAGSLEKDIQEKYGEPTPDALVESAFRHIDILDRLNFDNYKIKPKSIRCIYDR